MAFTRATIIESLKRNSKPVPEPPLLSYKEHYNVGEVSLDPKDLSEIPQHEKFDIKIMKTTSALICVVK